MQCGNIIVCIIINGLFNEEWSIEPRCSNNTRYSNRFCTDSSCSYTNIDSSQLRSITIKSCTCNRTCNRYIGGVQRQCSKDTNNLYITREITSISCEIIKLRNFGLRQSYCSNSNTVIITINNNGPRTYSQQTNYSYITINYQSSSCTTNSNFVCKGGYTNTHSKVRSITQTQDIV